LSGATTSRSHHRHPPSARHRDPRQSCCSRHDLSFAFPCGSFYPLDSRRVESAPARTASFTVSAALRDLRVRI
jgi:hypothetical protein